MNQTDKGTYKKPDPLEITNVYSDDHVNVDKKFKKKTCTSSWNKTR